jgi:ligand-binding SRPBCC domain-containing protein
MIIERQSVVDAPAEQVWARVVTPEGINDEVRPWMTMSMRAARNHSPSTMCR